MAIGDYQWFVERAPEITAQGNLNFDLKVQVCTAISPTVWGEIADGHFTVVITAVEFTALTATGTTAQKIAAVKARILADPRVIGVANADRAAKALNALLPGGIWPTLGVTGPIV